MIDRYLVNGSLRLRCNRLRFITVNVEHRRSYSLFLFIFLIKLHHAEIKKNDEWICEFHERFLFLDAKKARFDFNICFIITSTHQANEQIKHFFWRDALFVAWNILIYRLEISVHWWEVTPSVLLLTTEYMRISLCCCFDRKINRSKVIKNFVASHVGQYIFGRCVIVLSDTSSKHTTFVRKIAAKRKSIVQFIKTQKNDITKKNKAADYSS